MKISKIELTLLFFIVISAIIRFWNIGFQHMNYDEEFTITFAAPSLGAIGLIIQALTTDYTPPLYYLFAQLSMSLFGPTAEAIRYPSAVFGVMLVPVMYLIGKEFRDDLFGVIAAGLTTVFYNAIFYSRYGRSYSLDLVLCSMAFYYFMRLLKGDNKSGIPFGIFALLSLWTHLYSAIPLGIMVIYLLYERKAFAGITMMVAGALPLLNYIPLVLTTRNTDTNWCDFGATPMEILFLTPLDLFAYSGVIAFPVIVWSLWKHRDEKILRIITYISIITWASMFILSLKTPIILHYSIFLVPMLMMAFILPFWEALRDNIFSFHHACTVMVIIILEAVQIAALNTIQRGSW